MDRAGRGGAAGGGGDHRQPHRRARDARAYQTADQPDTPVVSTFIAMQAGDVFTAREQYSSRVLDEISKMDGYDPFTGSGRPTNDQSQRLRILATDVKADNPDQATVTFEVDTYASGGPFGSGNTWTSRRTVPVVRGRRLEAGRPGVFLLNAHSRGRRRPRG
ncbi:MAG: hypothetical protein R2838_11145 [Caldilineaceae bacterium]